MLGAIAGDIIGSVWEFNRINTKSFPLLTDGNGITDDSILTCAVAESILKDIDPVDCMRDWVNSVDIPMHLGGYGANFARWVGAAEKRPPYNSCGNGAAMRVSAAAWLARSLNHALEVSDQVTEVSHNHPEGIKGARATTHAIWLARNGESAKVIRETISREYGYDLKRSVDEIRETYTYNEICQQTVPEAITCALEASSFEDTVRNAVSLGGDADTLAAIAGSVGEGLFGIPDALRSSILEYLPDRMHMLLIDFESRSPCQHRLKY